MRIARFLSGPKRIVSGFAGISILAGLLVACNAILGDFEVRGDAGGSGSGQDGAPSGSDGSSDASTDATTNPGHDAASDGEAANDSAPVSDGGRASDTGAASDAENDSAVEAGPSCPPGQTPCSGSCVNLTNSPGDCGGCGHTCNLHTMYGGSSCQGGVCAPVELIGYVGEQFVDVGADDGLVFVHVDLPDGGSNISVCAADSCGGLTTFQQDPNPTANAMLASGEKVAWWTTHQGFWTDDDGGESMATPGFAAGSGLLTMSLGGGNVGYLYRNLVGHFLNVNAVGDFSWTTSFDAGTINVPVSMDATNVAFLLTGADGGGALETCSIASACTSALPIGPATSFANVLTPYAYLGLPAPSNVDAGPTIAYVSLTPSGPPAAPSVLTRLAPSVSLVQTAIDSTGFYWLDSAGNISMCPIAPATCPTGGVPVVKGSSPVATQFAVSNGFVFFLMASPNNNAVYEAEPPAH